MNLGFLASHHGSNMQAIINACKARTLQASPAVVISNNSDSGALARAKREGLPITTSVAGHILMLRSWTKPS